MGGETKTMTSGLAVAKVPRTSRTSVKTGSTRASTLDPARQDSEVKKLVRQATMHESEELRMDLRQSAMTDNLLQLMTWQSSIKGLARRLRAVMFWMTFVSPTMEKHRCWDIFESLESSVQFETLKSFKDPHDSQIF